MKDLKKLFPIQVGDYELVVETPYEGIEDDLALTKERANQIKNTYGYRNPLIDEESAIIGVEYKDGSLETYGLRQDYSDLTPEEFVETVVSGV